MDKEEVQEIKTLWSPLTSTINYDYWKFYKTLGFYSPTLVPDDIFAGQMIRILNPLMDANVFHKKALYDILYKDIRQPKIIVKSIDGQIYIKNKATLYSPEDILSTLRGRLIMKPAVNSSGGYGVEIVDFDNITDRELSELVKRMGKDFVCQEVIKQSKLTEQFNSSSLNTFRINTLKLNGLTTVTNIMFRHGKNRSVVDNAGSGGVCIGMDNDGTILHDGIDAQLKVYTELANGLRYKGYKIPNVANIVDKAIQAHEEYLPTLAHVAWDFALDENEEPIMIEVNLGWPGIITEQLSSRRSVYNTRVEEVIDYCIANVSKLDWRDFLGRWI